MNKKAFIAEYIGHSKTSILERLHEAIETIEELREYLAQSDTLYFKVRIEELQNKIKELESPRTCEGCKYEANTPLQPPCNLCSRQGTDRYEPEDGIE